MKKMQFKPTHRLQIGDKKNQTYLYVRISKRIVKNGKHYCNVFASDHEKSGIYSARMVPASLLEPLSKKGQQQQHEKTKERPINHKHEEAKEKRRLLWEAKENGDWLSVHEAAGILHVDDATVRGWISSGMLEATIYSRNSFQKCYFIKREIIEAIQSSGKMP